MKKNLLSFMPIALFAIAVTFTSCGGECQDCTVGGISAEICEKDFADEQAYNDFITNYEAAGGECN